MLMLISNLLYRHIHVQHYLSHGRTMLCWPLILEMRKFTQARPDSPEKRTPLIINIHTHIHTHVTVELNLSLGQYSREINYHATHTHTHTNKDMLR